MFAPFEHRLSIFEIETRLIYENDYRDENTNCQMEGLPCLPAKIYLPKKEKRKSPSLSLDQEKSDKWGKAKQ
ncbi:MAG: hypothetical protein AMJ94_02660 [Deltaproteobacteria bacterium SM23_61]|nr:MAG: hypothetical protein AMJ94_02660 [Deltaproteobacteria bacterium SM23_61]